MSINIQQQTVSSKLHLHNIFIIIIHNTPNNPMHNKSMSIICTEILTTATFTMVDKFQAKAKDKLLVKYQEVQHKWTIQLKNIITRFLLISLRTSHTLKARVKNKSWNQTFQINTIDTNVDACLLIAESQHNIGVLNKKLTVIIAIFIWLKMATDLWFNM